MRDYSPRSSYKSDNVPWSKAVTCRTASASKEIGGSIVVMASSWNTWFGTMSRRHLDRDGPSSCLYNPPEEFGFDIAAQHKNIGAWLDRMKALPGWAHPYDLMPGHPLSQSAA